MSATATLEVRVECYAGHCGGETPQRLALGGRIIEVIEVLDAWLAPEHRYFKVRGDDGACYILRSDVLTSRWELTMFDRTSAQKTLPMLASQPVASLALFTDLYELTMLQAYIEEGMTEQATFSLFARRLPERRNFVLACGLDDVLSYLESVRFNDDSLAYLASLGRFSGSFLAWLRDLRFTGDVHAVAEGTPVFANEPILEITAPIAEAQLVETFVVNQIHLQTTLASKAARVVAAARGRTVVDFGARRMHGTEAAVKAARAFFIAGVAATSNVLAGKTYGIPLAGTMAHSFVQAWPGESDAFRSFVRMYPETILLVDTYDTIRGVGRVCELARELGDRFRVKGVRLELRRSCRVGPAGAKDPGRGRSRQGRDLRQQRSRRGRDRRPRNPGSTGHGVRRRHQNGRF